MGNRNEEAGTSINDTAGTPETRRVQMTSARGHRTIVVRPDEVAAYEARGYRVDTKSYS
jgi:hypothetical protein